MEMELRSKDKLCVVYKDSADTAESKVVELTETLENVQSLFEESKQSTSRLLITVSADW